MARLLLINPSYVTTYGSTGGGLANPVYPVMGLAALAGEARRAGHQVEILDMSYTVYDPQLVIDAVRRFSPDVVGITATTPLANQMTDISYIIKNISSQIRVIGGGPHATAVMEASMEQSLLDAVGYGEADQTIVDLMNTDDWRGVSGLIMRSSSELIVSDPQSPVEDLDNLAMPAWDLFPKEVYERHITRIMARRSPVSMVEFSRGCVFTCDFCASKNTVGFGYRKKSPERCAEELGVLVKLGYKEVVLADDIFTSDNNWAIQVCEEIIRRKIDITWTCSNGIRVDSANDELFAVMKRAGCYRVHFGFESGNDEVLKAFGKGGKATLDQGISAVKMARKAGLDTFGMYMIGLSSDTEKTMQDTINYSKVVPTDAMRFGITVPFPGTKMFKDLHARGKIKSFDWDDYTVYNEANQIFDHPKIPWEVIKRTFRQAHLSSYLNVAYIVRRLKKSLKELEILWDIWFFLKFIRIFGLKRGREPVNNQYQYKHIWREKLENSSASVRYVEPLPINKIIKAKNL